MSKKSFYILTIDGGGIRGIFPAYFLKKIKDELNVTFYEQFDLIAGTSTGSIIAAALATNYPIDKIVQMYKLYGNSVFKNNILSMRGIFSSRFNKKNLKEMANDTFKNLTMSASKTRLLIPAVDIGKGNVHVFKSQYLKEFVRDKNVKISDAVIASCSAPSYFDPEEVGPYLLADGGIWANNPALVALIEAVGKLGRDIKRIKILSIGTGVGNRYYNHSSNSWGLATGWRRTQLIDTIFNLQSESAHNMVGLMLPKESYLRINFTENKKLSLDDTGMIPRLESLADYEFTHNYKTIKKFLNL
jgi:uncharacterized protein